MNWRAALSARGVTVLINAASNAPTTKQTRAAAFEPENYAADTGDTGGDVRRKRESRHGADCGVHARAVDGAAATLGTLHWRRHWTHASCSPA